MASWRSSGCRVRKILTAQRITEQAGQQHHLVRSCRSVRVHRITWKSSSQTLHPQRAPYGQVDDRGRRLPGIDLAVNQQTRLRNRDSGRREGPRDGDIWVIRHDLGFLAGKRDRTWRPA